MINIEKTVNNKFPNFAKKPAVIRKPTLSLMKKLGKEEKFNDFLSNNSHVDGFDFIDEVFDYFNFTYAVSARDRANIPAQGRVVIIANHPIGSLDGLAVLKMIGEIRRDVIIVANDVLSHFNHLQPLVVASSLNGQSDKPNQLAVDALQQEQAVIFFPAGEVSRVGPMGVKDGAWSPEFLHIARETSSPVLPIHISAKNSLLFYGASLCYRPMATALLAREMFSQQSSTIGFKVGEPIALSALISDNIHDRTLIKRLRKYLYRLGKNKAGKSKRSKHRVPVFETVKTIAHPEDRKALQQELKQAELLGQTRDGNRIYLVDYSASPSVMRELGCLREQSFRQVGEGTGSKRDLDKYDQHYRHLILWDSENLVIAGAYRIGEGAKILRSIGEEGFYTHSLYRFEPGFSKYLDQSIELGRSFVNPDYWGKASLDYLWQGIGAYLIKHPVRYVIGPVSMNAEYPRELTDTLVYFYRRYYACSEHLAVAHHPYDMSLSSKDRLEAEFAESSVDDAFDLMQKKFQAFGHKLPVLFKQYCALYEPGGFQSIVFSVDPNFGDCLDGMCMADITKLKENKRKRYMPGAT